MTGRDPGDPGGPQAGHLDPRVSEIIYSLRTLGVEGQATALGVLAAVDGADLTPEQIKAVLAGVGRTPIQRRGVCEICGGQLVEDPPGLYRHTEAPERAHDAWPGLTPVGPRYIPPERDSE